MKKVLSVFAQNLAYYNEGEIVGDWLELPTTREKIDEYLKEVVKVDDEHEEYEIADIDDCPFEYEIIQWANLHKINNLAIVFSSLDKTEQESVLAYCNSLSSDLDIDEIINISLQANKIPYYEYNSDYKGYPIDEKMGRTMADENGLTDMLEKMGVEQYFDYEGYGDDFSYEYELLENGYLEYSDNIDKEFYSKEEIDEEIDKLLIKDKYAQKEEKVLEKMSELKQKFRELTENDETLKSHFKNNEKFTEIMVAGTILAGIELRNLQRENNNLEGELEHSPFSAEMEKLIDQYTELEKEVEDIEKDYEMELN